MPKWVRKYKVQGDGSVYTISIDENGNFGCSCPGWRFKKEPRPPCKHIQHFEQLLCDLEKFVPEHAELYYQHKLAFAWKDNVIRNAERLVGIAKDDWVLVDSQRLRADPNEPGWNRIVLSYSIQEHGVGLPAEATEDEAVMLEVAYKFQSWC